ncbi:rab3 GTPase-activating protein catalytic subunit-like [Agrilus planipennis]|uniref:Rab3 GTPase-activating protein catalytic subunit n=1 Tax=Agrilus planipennis TaxID=224129 RepID=A0A1W4XJ41_AGRPL|nr:rab3 GTPase-activating protein catalytic subunit-like [Agrilus planipennis]
MMSASLLSDMESFKAANPGSILEDFIRWYSPRDFIEEDELDNWGQKKGHLSSRMLISDNTWVQMWASGKPVPANRQKRLFDDTREAEKVLHFLDSRNLSQIVELLLPVLSHVALLRLYEESQHVIQELPDSITTIRHIAKIIENASREGAVNTRRYESLIREISSLELKISEVNSLMYKFNPTGTTNETGREVEIEDKGDSMVGSRIVAMLSEAQKGANLLLTDQTDPEASGGDSKAFPNATQKEFVMRADAVRPATYSAKSPQFLRAILSKNEFRLTNRQYKHLSMDSETSEALSYSLEFEPSKQVSKDHVRVPQAGIDDSAIAKAGVISLIRECVIDVKKASATKLLLCWNMQEV